MRVKQERGSAEDPVVDADGWTASSPAQSAKKPKTMVLVCIMCGKKPKETRYCL